MFSDGYEQIVRYGLWKAHTDKDGIAVNNVRTAAGM